MRLFYILGWGYVAIAAALIMRANQPHASVSSQVFGAPVGSPAFQWFNAMRARCNPVEVAVNMTRTPPPQDWEGQAYGAACYALAGKIDRAQALIDALPGDRHQQAAGIIFDIGHPVADAGDDDSAGPMMSLVVRYWPNHYMALYHAGMAKYRLGQQGEAKQHLEDFLKYYDQNDGWTGSAKATLAEIGKR